MTNLDDDEAFIAARTQATRLRDQPTEPQPAANPAPAGRTFRLQPVGPGWMLYSTRRHLLADTPELHQPLGGICVEVQHDYRVDADTGEIVDQARYRCYTFRPSNPWAILDANEIDTQHLAGLDRISSTAAIRRLIRPLIKPATPKQLTPAERDALHDAWALALAISL